MKTDLFLKKMLIFTVGLFVMAMGVALSVKADLGVSPISCIPYVFSQKFPLTLGQLTILFNALLMVLQVLLLRRRYRLIQLVQLPMVLVFGLFIDLSLHLVASLNVSSYGMQVFWCLLSLVVLAFGVFLEVRSNFTYLPGEGFIVAIAESFKKEFGKVKVGCDSAMVVLGILCSLVFFHRLEGIREGTILAALFVGFLVKFIISKLPMLDHWVGSGSSVKTVVAPFPAAGKLIITISRESGSGGHEIGRHIATQLGIPFNDKALINLTAERSGFTEEYIQQNEQKLARTLLHELYAQNYAYVNDRLPPADVLFLVQSKIIRDICSRESCVIIGRCANFILKDTPNCFSVFIHANNEYRKSKIIRDYGTVSALTDKELEHLDQERANYCHHYTGKNWRDAANYHLTIDSSRYGSEHTARMIIEAAKEFER
ncbi:cytidylate kinase family protein [Pontiella sulfatireligans]|uniref:Cytidylate kinase n=1 Tax=Pontiella sulfatireligans TaxID=2750658 RepID=A0A6C2UJC9_9BACT|nr:cytidylate kinase family protein [Pontiella sulfatireligans]VGO20325.1 hypothetical protein SCARR_02387 [Pontiella sulfatireligans]